MTSTSNAFQPLSDNEVQEINKTVLKVLADIGMGTPSPSFTEVALTAGCSLSDEGRLCMPPALVEDIISRAKRVKTYHGRDPERSIDMTKNPVLYGISGFAPTIIDFKTGLYRGSLLLDHYDMMRLADKLEFVNLPMDSLAITDIPDSLERDLNKAYAMAAGTTKSIVMSFGNKENVLPVMTMFDSILGGEGRFKETPFCIAFGVGARSPMSYGEKECEILVEAARLGFPVCATSGPMAGSTAPATLAGTIVQTIAETLALLVQIELMVPGASITLTPGCFIADLRTGSCSVGSAEGALLNAGLGQMMNWYGLTGSVAGGMSDSKAMDIQCGAEKAMSAAVTTLSLAAKGGTVALTNGMMGSLMGYSFESVVFDNETLGTVQRLLRGIEVSEETLSFDIIADVISGSGHFLSHQQTIKCMRSEYIYPELSDRGGIEEWEERGRKGVMDGVREKAKTILSTHYPEYIEPGIDDLIRDRYPIKLPKEEMKPTSARWQDMA